MGTIVVVEAVGDGFEWRLVDGTVMRAGKSRVQQSKVIKSGTTETEADAVEAGQRALVKHRTRGRCVRTTLAEREGFHYRLSGMKKPSEFRNFRDFLRLLYHGSSPNSERFRLAVLAIDAAIIAFFIVTPVIRDTPTFLWIDYAIAAILGADIVARLLASTNIPRQFLQLTTWVDIFILATLLLPSSLSNFGFLRILRLWTVSQSGWLWRPLKRLGYESWRETGQAIVNLVTFLFVFTGFVYTFFFQSQAGLNGYIDALYFTVAAITTTGFGDIVLPGPWGKLTSIAAMVIGITLFIRLAQSLFRPFKVYFPCPKCALQRHDPDAVHCKACGELLAIPDEGLN